MVQTSGQRRRVGQHARLTALQRRFVDELLQDPQRNAHEAARRAGSPDTKCVWSTRTMQKPHVLAAIAAADAARVKRVEVKQDEVLREMLRVAYSDLNLLLDADGKALPVKQWPKKFRRAVASIEFDELGKVAKVKLWDKLRALDALGRHLPGFYAPQKMEHDLGRSLEELIADADKPEERK